ncbi:extracellular solute-binding protein [Hymenobacter jeollabukensis]|uniref:Extracellular solute-binding protein n=1 Tax=Hymenobacter jeollabukensis TaxID=2025313 RepID=A0A5R8WLB5_9BACT|nr:extracellular solute-binding protein [Hymenobacter jeollabukensis]TLM89784.1 extracellular solute-binding protein [Hymenobacter jeollabukensis]
MPEQQPFRVAVRKFAPFEAHMQKLWAAFCAHSGCTLPAEFVALDLHPLHQSLLTDQGLATGAWDLAHINTDWLPEAQAASALLDLAPLIRQNPPADFPQGWSPSLLGMQEYGGTTLGLPFHDGPECLIYRKDLFDSPTEQAEFRQLHGRPLQPPATWEELQQVARFFHRPEQNLYGFVAAGYPDGHNTVFDFCLHLWTRGGQLHDGQDRLQIDSEAARAGLSFYRQLLRDTNAIHPQSMQYESVRAGQAFARGEAALMINWFGFAAVCEVDDACPVRGKVDITAVPRGENTVGSSASLNVYWLYAIGSGSRHQQLAYDFIRFALSPENDKQLTLEGGIGCRLSTWHDPDINARVPYYHKLAELHEKAETLPQKANWAQLAAVIDEAVLRALNTDEPVAELLAAAQLKINALDNPLDYV